MKIRFTSVCSPEAGSRFNPVTVALEDKLIPIFAGRTFGDGVDQFVVVVVAVDTDPEENAKFERKHHSVGRYKDVRTGDKVRFISIALPFDPDDVVSMTESELRSNLVAALLNRLKTLDLKIPKQFEYPAFVEQLEQSLSDELGGTNQRGTNKKSKGPGSN